MKLSSPASRCATSAPALPSMSSSPSPPSRRSAPSPPRIESSPGAAVDGELESHGEPEAARDVVVTAERVHAQQVVGGLGMHDAHVGRQSGHSDRVREGIDLDVVGAPGRVAAEERHRVRLTVARGPPDGGGEVDVERLDVRPPQVVHDGGVRTAERSEIDALGTVDVHDDVAEVAEEAKPLPVGGSVEALAHACTVEDERVVSRLSFDLVAAIARIPREAVVTGAEEGLVGALVPVDLVVAGSAEERLHPCAAEEIVVVVPAAEGGRLGVGEDPVRVVDAETVVPIVGLDRDPRERVPSEGEDAVRRHDLEGRRIPCAQAENDLLSRIRALDDRGSPS